MAERPTCPKCGAAMNLHACKPDPRAACNEDWTPPPGQDEAVDLVYACPKCGACVTVRETV